MAGGSGNPEWMIREDAGMPVLLALYLRQAIGVRSPDELPSLRGTPARTGPDREEDAQARLERQWLEYWAMTVEPQAHPSPVPLELVDDFETVIALPAEGTADLRAAIIPHAPAALAYARSANARYSSDVRAKPGVSYRAYASAIAEHERRVGRRAHSFELNVQVLPLTQRGVWWIGSLTVAVTDGLRGDVVAFDAAIHPIIAELA
ncbi:zinc-binding alcohol dehydrogenase [Microbacterium sp. P06]|uniref:zinc-binding alcohol dehydrogenase n=1 Tax=unclassified Microbacterium TaxID=2609290 RepID=UPI0037475CB5